MLAVHNGNYEAVGLLIGAGAPLGSKDNVRQRFFIGTCMGVCVCMYVCVCVCAYVFVCVYSSIILYDK